MPPTPSDARLPLIGISCDVQDVPQPSVIRQRVVVATTYAECVVRAGGVPVMMLPEVSLATQYVQSLDAIVLTGGMDIDTRLLVGADGSPHPARAALHAKAEVMHARRQAFELALLAAIDARPNLPVLGVCLGMQLMGVHHGCRMIQHLADTLGDERGESHRHDTHHGITPTPAWATSRLAPLDATATVASNHHQGIEAASLESPAASPLRVLAWSSDGVGVIEAIDDPTRAHYVGVQWHPERTKDAALGQRVFDELVRAARVSG